MKIFSAKTGFTLAESLISMILLAIIVSGGMGFYHFSTEVMVKAMQKKIATEMAKQAMEQTKAFGSPCLTYPSPVGCPSTAPLGTWENPATVTYSFLNQDFSVQQCRRITNVEGTSPNINKRVETQVCWPATGACPCSTTHMIDLATNIYVP